MARQRTPKGFNESKTPYGARRSASKGADEVARDRGKLPEPEILPDGTQRYFMVLGAKGRVLLPAEMRAAMGLKEDDVITAWLKDGELRMHSHLHGLRKIQREASPTAKGGVYASDELIAERRAEAANEARDALQWQRDRKRKR